MAGEKEKTVLTDKQILDSYMGIEGMMIGEMWETIKQALEQNYPNKYSEKEKLEGYLFNRRPVEFLLMYERMRLGGFLKPASQVITNDAES